MAGLRKQSGYLTEVPVNPVGNRLCSAGGFTLLEILIALTILAIGLGVITFANSTAMTQVSRVTRMTTASFLMEGVVNDIQDYYVRKGFPSNDLEDKECELPREFSDTFDCRYDLQAMDIEQSAMQELIQAGMESFTSSMGSLAGGEEGAPTDGMSGMDMGKMAAMAPLFGPMGGEIMSLCNINLSQLMMGITMLSSYMPQIIDQVAKKTRKMTVRMTWKDGPRKQRTFTVQTFVVSLPEEEVTAMREAEVARENQQDQIDSSAPPTDPNNKGKTPPPADDPVKKALDALKGLGGKK
jgi:prepilin-type N-terminal cleavage/methylation domain-containing protein